MLHVAYLMYTSMSIADQLRGAADMREGALVSTWKVVTALLGLYAVPVQVLLVTIK